MSFEIKEEKERLKAFMNNSLLQTERRAPAAMPFSFVYGGKPAAAVFTYRRE